MYLYQINYQRVCHLFIHALCPKASLQSKSIPTFVSHTHLLIIHRHVANTERWHWPHAVIDVHRSIDELSGIIQGNLIRNAAQPVKLAIVQGNHRPRSEVSIVVGKDSITDAESKG